MRRTIMIGTALVALVCAGVAYAALNTYTAKLTFTSSKPGTTKKPVALGWAQNLGASNATSGSRAAPLIEIKTTIYGLETNAKNFPTCSKATILTGPKFDGNCKPKAMIGGGVVQALLGGTDLTGPGVPCKTYLHIWNAGGNKAWYFFTTKTAADCGGLTTGQTAPYPGTMKQVGKKLVIDVPLPPDVSTMVAGHPNFYGSLISESLTYPKHSVVVKHKSVSFWDSFACKGKTRPWTVAYTATNVSGTKETKIVKGSAKC